METMEMTAKPKTYSSHYEYAKKTVESWPSWKKEHVSAKACSSKASSEIKKAS